MAKGSVRKKGKKWYYRFYIEDESGRKVQKEFVGTESKSETEALLRKAIADYEEKKFVAKSENITVGMLLDLWVEEELKPGSLSNGTVSAYQGTVGRIKQFPIGERKLKTVTPNSVIHYHAVIYQALKYAMKTDMVPQNVAMKVDRPRKNSFQPTFLDAEQMQKLFEVVKGTRLELPVLVAAFYGLRRGEVLGLKWDAIDFNRGTLTIKRTVTEATIDGTMKIIELDSAKTKSSLRTLPLVGSFRDYFQKVKEAQELNKKVCGNCYNYDYDGYVFVNELGERMRPNYLTEYFPKYIAKHGMPKMRFHDLRHSCASLLLANGVPLKQIQEWLGHSDFSTTANIYAHLDYRSKISSAQAMEQGMLLPRSDDFGSRWEDVTEQGKITEPDLNPVF